MSMWKKAMDYLGLGPDDAYDDYPPEPEYEQRPVRSARPARDEGMRPQRGYDPGYDPEPPVRAVNARPSYPLASPDVTVRGPMPARDDSNVQPRPINPRPPVAARPAAGSEPYTVRPRRFDSAQEVADKFKEGLPVIMNLEGADRETSRRLIDFASGLCYGLNGTMEKVASGVYLLKPPVRHNGYDTTGYGA
jgi:cell division inhibitor SepF